MKTIFLFIITCNLISLLSAQYPSKYNQFHRRNITDQEIHLFGHINQYYDNKINFLDTIVLKKAIVDQRYFIDSASHDSIFFPLKRFSVQTRNSEEHCSDCSYGFSFDYYPLQDKIIFRSSGMGGSTYDEIRFANQCYTRINRNVSDYYSNFYVIHEHDTIYESETSNQTIVVVKGVAVDLPEVKTDIVTLPCENGKNILISKNGHFTSYFEDNIFLASFHLDSIYITAFNPLYRTQSQQTLMRIIIDSIYFKDSRDQKILRTTKQGRRDTSDMNIQEYNYYSDTLFLVSEANVSANLKLDSTYIGVIHKNSNDQNWYMNKLIFQNEYEWTLRRYYKLDTIVSLSIDEIDTLYQGYTAISWGDEPLSYQPKKTRKQYFKQLKLYSIKDPDHLLLDPFLFYLNYELFRITSKEQ